MLRAMETDMFDEAACAASDLTARLLGDLAHARSRLAALDARLCAAVTAGQPVTETLRNARSTSRSEVGALLHVLAGMPLTGEHHAQSA